MVFVRYIFIIFLFTPIKVIAYENNSDQRNFDSKIAVVDVESILEHSLAIKEIKKVISGIGAQIQNDMIYNEIELKKIEHELITQRGFMSDNDFNVKLSEFNKKVSLVQQEMQLKKAALEQAHSDAIAEVHKNMIEIINDLSKKYGFNIVFPASQVIFVKNDLNITLEVITNLNEKIQSVKVNYNLNN